MELLSKRQVMAELGVSERTLETWVSNQRFPAPVRIGRHVYWSREALERWKTLSFAYQLEFKPG